MFAIDADPSSATMLSSVATSADTIAEPNTMEDEDLRHNQKDSSVSYVVVFKDEESLNAAISEIQQNRLLSEVGKITNSEDANILSSIRRFNMLVVQLPDKESSKEEFVRKYSKGIKDVCLDSIESEDGKCILVSNHCNL